MSPPDFPGSAISPERASCVTPGDTQRSCRKLGCALGGIIPVCASVSLCKVKGESPQDPLPFTAAPVPAACLPRWLGSAATPLQWLPQGLGLDSAISAGRALLSW